MFVNAYAFNKAITDLADKSGIYDVLDDVNKQCGKSSLLLHMPKTMIYIRYSLFLNRG